MSHRKCRPCLTPAEALVWWHTGVRERMLEQCKVALKRRLDSLLVAFFWLLCFAATFLTGHFRRRPQRGVILVGYRQSHLQGALKSHHHKRIHLIITGDAAVVKEILPQSIRGAEGHSDSANDVFSGILSSNQDTPRFMIQGDIAVKRNRNALSCPGKSCLWAKTPDGVVPVPYSLSDNYTSDEKDVIKGAMEELMVLTCIRFVVRTIEPNHLKIHPVDGCWSYIGRVGGTQDVSLTKTGCLHRGIIQHELLHSLGFQHEQCRSDRDKYIRINWGNISQDKERNFYKLSTQNLGIPYDYHSVLHYGKYAFANDAGKPTLEPTGNPDATIGQRVGLSSLDVVKINKLYKCSLCAYLLPDARGGFSWQSSQQPNVSRCLWLIRVPEGKIFLQFESCNGKSSQACGYGNIKVYDGASRDSPLIPTKPVQPFGLMSTGNLMRVEFERKREEVNFKATYSSDLDRCCSR